MVAKAANTKSVNEDFGENVRIRWKVGAYVVAVVLLLTSFTYAYQQVTRDDVLPITELKVVGEFDQVSSKALKELIVNNLHGNFFTVDVASIHRAVTGLPWVHFAWVDRVWPQTLQVRVVEEKPYAYLEQAGLVNVNGEIFLNEVGTDMLKGLPRLSGSIEYRDKLLGQYKQLVNAFRVYDLKVTELALDRRGSWKLKLSNDVEIVLGHEAVDIRLHRFLKIFGKQMAEGENRFKRVDLRYANGFALSEVEALTNATVS